jgi:hypothetical protein
MRRPLPPLPSTLLQRSETQASESMKPALCKYVPTGFNFRVKEGTVLYHNLLGIKWKTVSKKQDSHAENIS